MIEKTCRTCGYVGPVEDFVKTRNWCKECSNEYNRNHRVKKEVTKKDKGICSKCGYEGPPDKFKKGRSICKQCVNAGSRNQRANIDPTKIKTCKLCGFTGSALEFVKHQRICKTCQTKINQATYASDLLVNREKSRKNRADMRAKNPERENERSRNWNNSHPDKVKEWASRYRKANPEKVSVGKQVCYERDKERVCEKNRKWKKDNPGAVRAHNNNRKAKKKSRPGVHTPQDIEKLLLDQEGLCVYCGDFLEKGYHVDHIIPLVREDSTNWPDNLQVLCPSCNCSKGDKDHEEYLAYRRALGLFIYCEKEEAA